MGNDDFWIDESLDLGMPMWDAEFGIEGQQGCILCRRTLDVSCADALTGLIFFNGQGEGMPGIDQILGERSVCLVHSSTDVRTADIPFPATATADAVAANGAAADGQVGLENGMQCACVSSNTFAPSDTPQSSRSLQTRQWRWSSRSQ